ncbi:MAG: type II toxin-antitoxin system RelE/ParE family toxin [Bacteroidota bacterium]
MAAKVIWSPRAVTDLEDTCNYIARDSQRYASVFASTILTLVKQIPQFPEAGRIVPEYGDAMLREKIYGNYRIVYRIKPDAIEIVAIHHGARIFTL